MIANLLEFAKAQGFSITILAVLSYIFWGKMEQMEDRLTDCQNAKVEMLEQVVKQNTEALFSIQKYFEK